MAVGSRLGRGQKHIGGDRHSHFAPMAIGKIHLPHRDRRTGAQEPRPSQQAAFGDRPEVVDLQFDSCETARSAKLVLERGPHRRVRQARRDAAVDRSGAVQQFRTHPAADRDAIAMYPDQLESQQMVECVTREKVDSLLTAAFRVGQVC